MKISFDFDDTLSRKYVQTFAKKLIKQRVDVHIITSRYENLDDYLPVIWLKGHEDLFKIADKLKISRENIHFTNFISKYQYILGKKYAFHIDNDPLEVHLINQYTQCIGIDCTEWDWKDKILATLKNGVLT
jgi:hypothetical protein